MNRQDNRAFKNAVLKGIRDVSDGKTISLKMAGSRLGKRKVKSKMVVKKVSLRFAKPAAHKNQEIRRRYA
jgi:hypothetical protein